MDNVKDFNGWDAWAAFMFAHDRKHNDIVVQRLIDRFDDAPLFIQVKAWHGVRFTKFDSFDVHAQAEC